MAAVVASIALGAAEAGGDDGELLEGGVNHGVKADVVDLTSTLTVGGGEQREQREHRWYEHCRHGELILDTHYLALMILTIFKKRSGFVIFTAFLSKYTICDDPR